MHEYDKAFIRLVAIMVGVVMAATAACTLILRYLL